jgi:hypothetical protein
MSGQVLICEVLKRLRRKKNKFGVFNADKLSLEEAIDLSSDRLPNERDNYTNGNT